MAWRKWTATLLDLPRFDVWIDLCTDSTCSGVQLEDFKRLISGGVIQRPNVPLSSRFCTAAWRGPEPDLHLFELGPCHQFREGIRAIEDLLRSGMFFDQQQNYKKHLLHDPRTPIPPDPNDPTTSVTQLEEAWMDNCWKPEQGVKYDALKALVYVPPSRLKRWTRECIDAFRSDQVRNGPLYHRLLELQVICHPSICALVAEYAEYAWDQLLAIKNYLPFMRYGLDYAAWTNNLRAARCIVVATETNGSGMTSTAMTIAAAMGYEEFCAAAEKMNWTPPRNGGYEAVRKHAQSIQQMSDAERAQHADNIKKKFMMHFCHTQWDIGQGGIVSVAHSEALACSEDYLY